MLSHGGQRTRLLTTGDSNSRLTTTTRLPDHVAVRVGEGTDVHGLRIGHLSLAAPPQMCGRLVDGGVAHRELPRRRARATWSGRRVVVVSRELESPVVSNRVRWPP